MDQRTQFVREAVRWHEDMTVLCARYGISRKTGYKWVARYEGGVPGLDELSRRPHRSPGATEAAVVAAVLLVRERHPTWGGKTLEATLVRRGRSCRGVLRARFKR